MPSARTRGARNEEQTVQDPAQRTIEEAQIIRLSIEDQRTLAAAILDPPAPSPSLVRAAEAHRCLIQDL
jgi:uncharacterized protein (DUF1778 family)